MNILIWLLPIKSDSWPDPYNTFIVEFYSIFLENYNVFGSSHSYRFQLLGNSFQYNALGRARVMVGRCGRRLCFYLKIFLVPALLTFPHERSLNNERCLMTGWFDNWMKQMFACGVTDMSRNKQRAQRWHPAHLSQMLMFDSSRWRINPDRFFWLIYITCCHVSHLFWVNGI